MDLQFRLIDRPTDGDIDAVRARLQAFNAPFWEVKEKQTLVLQVTDETRLVAGAVLTVYGRWVEIQFLWVDEADRRRGLGSRLLADIEALGRQRSCAKLSLNTFSFQARPFYEKNGFRVVYTKENYPLTSTQYFMEKDIGPP